MAEKNIDAGKESPALKSAESSASPVEEKVTAEISTTKNKINAVVPTDKPDNKSKPKAEVAQPEPKQTKQAAATRTLSADQPASGDEPKNFTRYATIGVLGGAAAMASLSPSILAQFPLIGKIPYLPQAAAALQAGINSMITPLGFGTGTQATNTLMAGLLPTGVGAALTGAALIPAGLWSIGMAKSLLTGEKYGLGMGNIKEASRTIVGLPSKTYGAVIDARNWAGKKVGQTWNIAKAPFAGAWNIARNITKGAWHATASTTSAALKPTKWGMGGALLGTAIAAGTGGAALPVLAGGGYALLNYLKNTGAMDGKSST